MPFSKLAGSCGVSARRGCRVEHQQRRTEAVQNSLARGGGRPEDGQGAEGSVQRPRVCRPTHRSVQQTQLLLSITWCIRIQSRTSNPEYQARSPIQGECVLLRSTEFPRSGISAAALRVGQSSSADHQSHLCKHVRTRKMFARFRPLITNFFLVPAGRTFSTSMVSPFCCYSHVSNPANSHIY